MKKPRILKIGSLLSETHNQLNNLTLKHCFIALQLGTCNDRRKQLMAFPNLVDYHDTSRC